MKKELIITITASSDCFGAYAENCDGIWASGETVEACRQDVLRAIALIKEELPEEQWPEPLRGEYAIRWQYDTESFLYYFGGIMSLSGLERLTSINQKQLWAYMHGRRAPRKEQKDKIREHLLSFARELEAAVLI